MMMNMRRVCADMRVRLWLDAAHLPPFRPIIDVTTTSTSDPRCHCLSACVFALIRRYAIAQSSMPRYRRCRTQMPFTDTSERPADVCRLHDGSMLIATPIID